MCEKQTCYCSNINKNVPFGIFNFIKTQNQVYGKYKIFYYFL